MHNLQNIRHWCESLWYSAHNDKGEESERANDWEIERFGPLVLRLNNTDIFYVFVMFECRNE